MGSPPNHSMERYTLITKPVRVRNVPIPQKNEGA